MKTLIIKYQGELKYILNCGIDVAWFAEWHRELNNDEIDTLKKHFSE